MKIGLFGGTFDPIHFGHLIIAETVRSDFGLDRILFIPAAVSPHKAKTSLSPAPLRLTMVELALENTLYFEASDVEIKRGGFSYTVETVQWFQESDNWKGNEFYLLIGSDSLLELGTWKDPDKILGKIPILVMERPGFDSGKAEKQFQKRIVPVKVLFIDISSSEIRRRVKEGKSIRYWVPEKVEEYIRQKRLYL